MLKRKTLVLALSSRIANLYFLDLVLAMAQDNVLLVVVWDGYIFLVYTLQEHEEENILQCVECVFIINSSSNTGKQHQTFKGNNNMP